MPSSDNEEDEDDDSIFYTGVQANHGNKIKKLWLILLESTENIAKLKLSEYFPFYKVDCSVQNYNSKAHSVLQTMRVILRNNSNIYASF